MIKKILFFTGVLIGIVLQTQAQEAKQEHLDMLYNNTEKLKIAQNYFDSKDYNLAAYHFQTIVDDYPKEIEAVTGLGRCYYQMGEFQNAYNTFRQLQSIGELANPSDIRKYEKAKKFTENKLYLSDNFFIERTNINSSQTDLGPTFYKDGIVFASTRSDKKKKKGKSKKNTSFLDVYYAPAAQGQGAIFNKATKLKGEINTKNHDGPAVFFNGGNQVVFTRNVPKKTKGKIENHLKLFFARYDGNKKEWIDLVPFAFNSDAYDISQPAISEDGTYMVFVSNMKGSLGGSDLFYSVKEGGKWSEPKNMGAWINTPQNELFPWIHADGRMYFASSGREGQGGIDIYMIENYRSKKQDIVDLAYPINTEKDDFGYIINKEGTEGYLASNRGENKTGDDIYYFKYQVPEEAPIVDNVQQSTGTPEDILSPSDLIAQTESLEETTSLNDDKMSAWEDFNLKLDLGEAQLLMVNNIALSSQIFLDGENNFYEIIKDMDNENGYALQNNKTVISLSDFFSPALMEDLNNKKLAGQFIAEGLGIDRTASINTINYQFDESTINKAGKESLDVIVDFMTRHEAIHIDISAFTDSRGRKDYNKKLSERRAYAVAQYLRDNGIDVTRIITHHMGEDMLINYCEDGMQCSEEEHAENRRAEFRFDY